MSKLLNALSALIMYYGEHGANQPSYHGAYEPKVPNVFSRESH